MKKLASMLLTCMTAISLVACGSTQSSSPNAEVQEESTLERAKQEGVVKVGFANEKPYAYATADGKLTGEAVEVARAVLKNMGINEMDGVLTEFGSLIPGLKAGRFDLITAGMFITPARAKEVAFADPEYSIGEALAVKPSNPKGLHSYEDIAAQPDVKVAVMGGAIENEYLLKVGVARDQIVTVPDNPSAIAALESGRVDAITMTGPSLQALLEISPEGKLERVMDFKQPVIDGESVRGYGATAFRLEDDDFRQAFNRELQLLKESGELLEILQQFGFTEQELPGDVTLEQLLKE
ncbi:ectoine/hydroxyectoine ABC transporter substrate-binding protein EhuB [Ammoniphilus sp. CFH 90114]|uniref:ectoine/hydroxyectoine ABC transporter substrate-binding protein EhuB n=1 Tax=Ammoniphilus sp. CFH 90114 TaxID=2493665 RepID=UPI00100E984E|nr:ectoine/hydroxyectoine ABC transporter substrate-binding protein EhuB [Ammoniphilus sp. CFH 90114]RXT07240.1 ectoine/hydroxyectoine ABC transporter substrate-binding protein EhuB [Ammoniphilus sp. CFH 90114]